MSVTARSAPFDTPTRVASRSRLFGALAAAVLVAVVLALAVEPALAQAGPFGVAAPEAGGYVPNGGIFGWIAARQNEFYRALTAGLKAMRADPRAGLWLVVVSFGYGVFHAAGPGHGKAVITSYVLANRETLRRGVLLSFLSAMVQGLVAIVFVGLAILVFRMTSLQMTDATTAFERTSAAAILGLGLWLSWTKIVAPALLWRRRVATPVAASEAGAVEISIGAIAAPRGVGGLGAAAKKGAPGASAAFVAPGTAPQSAALGAAAPARGRTAARLAELCACGQSHTPDPTTLGGEFDVKRALTAIAAVGIRPCTGALIVLVFAFAQGLPWAGVMAVVAMALGTGITVAALASLAVSARAVALRFAGDDGAWTLIVMRGAEVCGALLVLSMGVLLAGAALWGGPVGG